MRSLRLSIVDRGGASTRPGGGDPRPALRRHSALVFKFGGPLSRAIAGSGSNDRGPAMLGLCHSASFPPPPPHRRLTLRCRPSDTEAATSGHCSDALRLSFEKIRIHHLANRDIVRRPRHRRRIGPTSNIKGGDAGGTRTRDLWKERYDLFSF